jgi:hypothetical protein
MLSARNIVSGKPTPATLGSRAERKLHADEGSE